MLHMLLHQAKNSRKNYYTIIEKLIIEEIITLI